MAEVRDIFAEILKMLVMKKLENELRLINLKEWITNHPEVVNRMVQIIGTNQGWKELCVELKSPYNIVRRLKDMPICELNYSKRDFTMMRQEMYKQSVIRIVNDCERLSMVIINSRAATVEVRYQAKNKLELVTILKNRLIRKTVCANENLEEIQIKHDTNAPIFIFGEVEQLVCFGCKLTECYIKNCQYLSNIDLNDNKIKHFEIHSTFNLKNINLANNPIDIMDVKKILSQLRGFCKKDLFDEAPIIYLTTDITDDIRVKLKQLDWRIIVGGNCNYYG